ncbi:alpha/beta hydrolase fold protein [Mycobacterium sp. MFM001]|uniref:alpha/beta fold hydrolase n=1 Tax=Mycobacterium sp. MFM001 TaxID=2049453 RepID=UPI000DA5115E|nr:alpha/beta hydrolase [Mycobacterium sp. MFM001]GBE66950.1 alpha/beta hydrolase fold protein [Mycobacterium sp. MFM001]
MITEARVSYNGVATRALSVSGDGTPIIALHGYADTADTWRGVLIGLEAAGRRAVAVDLPGFGYADPRAPGPMLGQFDGFVDDILAQCSPAVLIGNSLGAATAVRAASRNPVRVKAIVALDDPLNARHWLARLARSREVPERVWSRLGRVRVPPTVLRRGVRCALARALYGPAGSCQAEVLDQWCDRLTTANDLASLGRYAFQYAMETAGGHRNLTVTCPTLIIHGRRDRVIPVDSSRRLHHQVPGSEFVVLNRSGHCPQLDDPCEVVRLVLDFLRRSGDHVGRAG